MNVFPFGIYVTPLLCLYIVDAIDQHPPCYFYLLVAFVILDESKTAESTYFSYKVKHSAIYVAGCILFVKVGTLHSGKDSQRYFQHFSICLSGSFFEYRLTTIARIKEMGRAINWASITVQGNPARVDFPKRYWAMPTA